MVAHICSPSNSGVGDQEDCGLRPPWQEVSKNPSQPIKAEYNSAHLSVQLCEAHK
jgi:hypothetical protein